MSESGAETDADGATTGTGKSRARRKSVWEQPERTVRAATEPLSRGQIVRAAIALIDSDGLDALTMRRLASRMGVGAMSLYWHVEKKSDLIELVADGIFGELDLPEHPSGDWRTDLRQISISTRALFTRHPWLLSSFGLDQPHFGPNFLRHVEFSFAALARMGVDRATMVAVVNALDSFVFGTVLHATATATHQSTAVGNSHRDQAFADAIAGGEYPTLESLQETFAGWDDDYPAIDDHNFTFGLEALLDGIELRLRRDGYIPEAP